MKTASLLLRPFRPEDAPKVFRMSREHRSRRWLPSQVYRDEAHAASVLAHLIAQVADPADPRRGPYVLGIELLATGDLIGHVGLSPLGEGVEIGFAIERAQERRGYATEAVRAMCAWAIGTFPLFAILGVTDAGNTASQRTLVRAGFVRHNETVQRFQGREQPVVVFAFPGRDPETA